MNGYFPYSQIISNLSTSAKSSKSASAFFSGWNVYNDTQVLTEATAVSSELFY